MCVCALKTQKKKIKKSLDCIYICMYICIQSTTKKNQIMENTTQNKFEIGSEVVRSKGDYVVGRIGRVIALDTEKNRAQVEWYTASNSWVKCECLELTSIPYEIVIGKGMCRKTGRIEWDTYRRLA